MNLPCRFVVLAALGAFVASSATVAAAEPGHLPRRGAWVGATDVTSAMVRQALIDATSAKCRAT